MKNIAIAFALTTVATVSAVACGDSDSNPADGGKGGSSGASGASGDAGVSGAGAPMGGTAGAGPTGGASGAVTGGAAGNAGGGAGGATGGTGGSDGGVGAEGGNSDGGVGAEGGMGPTTGCPTAEPAAMTMCGTRGLSCDLGDRVCRCNLGTGNWQCLDENGDCPAMPDPNGDCTGGQTACSYGEAGTCVCVMGNFTCDAGVVACPAMQPMDGAGCNMFPAGFDCTYAAGTCSCLAAGGGGMMRDWNCTTATDCPAMAPMNDSACTTPGLICPYTTPGPATPDPTCICNTMSQWECITP